MDIDNECLGMDKTKLIAFFLFPVLLAGPGYAASGENKLDREFYLDLVIQEKDKSFTDIKVGPCLWSVAGQQYDNSLLRVRNLQLLDDEVGTGDPGYRVALRCQDSNAKAFDVQLGFAKGISPSQILNSQETFMGIIDDTAVFLAFRYNIGSKRKD